VAVISIGPPASPRGVCVLKVVNRFVVLLLVVSATNLSLARPPVAPAKLHPDAGAERNFASLYFPGFAYRLVATGPAAVAPLRAALAHLSRSGGDDIEGINLYLKRYRGGFEGSLLLNLALLRQQQGYLSESRNLLSRAWIALKQYRTGILKIQSDRALAELALVETRAGDFEAATRLLKGTKGTSLSGEATERVHLAQEALTSHLRSTSDAASCANDAIHILASRLEKPLSEGTVVHSDAPNGTSLSALENFARQNGIPVYSARCPQGAKPLVPSIVHWKLGHYAVVLGCSGKYVEVLDPSFGGRKRMSLDAFDAEASGAFLVHEENRDAWRPLSDLEAIAVTGAGDVGSTSPGCPGGGPPAGGSCKSPSGMATYQFSLPMASLLISDSPVGYTPAVGPAVRLDLRYNHREYTDLPSTVSNFGPKWKFNFLQYVEDNPNDPNASPVVRLGFGGWEQNPLNAFDMTSRARLVRISTSPIQYARYLPDGSAEFYTVSDGGTGVRNVYLTRTTDPWGNAVRISYYTAGGIRINSITDAVGRVTQFSYHFVDGNNNLIDPARITSVTDPYGRSATFKYSTTAPYHLLQIQDTIGLQSKFTYSTTANSDFITALQTPYGTTTFSTSDETSDPTNVSNEWTSATDPLHNTERVQFEAHPVAIPNSEAFVPLESRFNDYLSYRNSFYWNKLAYKYYGASSSPRFDQAVIYHWLHDGRNGGAASFTLDSLKRPLENREWYIYDGQGSTIYTDPAMIGNQPSATIVPLFSGEEINRQVTHNLSGFPTMEIDATGRKKIYTYAGNRTDLLKVQVQGATGPETIWQASNYLNHKPQTVTTAWGKSYTLTYNAFGEVATSTDPLLHKTSYQYDTKGRLTKILGPADETLASYTYDNFDRVATDTDNLGQVRTYSYDAADRVTTISYQDGTSRTYTYSRLDVASETDRQGRTKTFQYSPLRQLILEKDPENRVTQFTWCLCGAFKGYYDPLGHSTVISHDIEGRPIKKTYDDGSFYSYRYESDSGRLRSATDPKGQIKLLTYNLDGSIASIYYGHAAVATPSVEFAYDPYVMRVTSMTDGTGLTSFTYAPYDGSTFGAGQVTQVQAPGVDPVLFTYDELGRRASVSVAGKLDSFGYDALGRPSNEINPLGSFTTAYLGASNLVASTAGGPVSTTFGYSALPSTIRLTDITNKAGATTLSKFDYTRSKEGDIATWSGAYQAGGTPGVLNESYDHDSWVTGSVAKSGSSVLSNDQYQYDAAGNRTQRTFNTLTSSYVNNDVNEVLTEDTKSSADATLHQHYDYAYDLDGSLASFAFTDAKTPANNSSALLTWDAQNRLVAYESGTHRSEFSYNGMNLCTKIVEKTSGVISSTRYLTWVDQGLYAEKSSGLTKHYYGQGALELNGTPYFYTRDHLGSIREVVDSTGAVKSRYQYDSYGVQTAITQAYASSIGYAGYVKHLNSGSLMTLYRFYAPRLGRWISRDPIGERGGVNLFRYCSGHSLLERDASGLLSCTGTVQVVTITGCFLASAPFIAVPIVAAAVGAACAVYMVVVFDGDCDGPTPCPSTPPSISKGPPRQPSHNPNPVPTPYPSPAPAPTPLEGY
jgi:RHS repeat-associated protein